TTRWGDFLLGVLIYVPVWTLFYRAETGFIIYLAVGFLPFFTVAVLHHVSAVALRTPRPPWIPLGTALVFTPFLFAWLVGSAVWWVNASSKPLVETVRSSTAARPTHGCESTKVEWEIDGRRLRVAVALSCGGYRAALAHAGLLASLDEQCVPIEY